MKNANETHPSDLVVALEKIKSASADLKRHINQDPAVEGALTPELMELGAQLQQLTARAVALGFQQRIHSGTLAVLLGITHETVLMHRVNQLDNNCEHHLVKNSVE